MAERKRKLASIVAPNDDALNEFQVNNKSQKLLSAEPSNSNVLPHQASKVFNDPVHGHIELHPLCTKIVDTPQFQRLRDIKQLGGCYLVFPGASHNRFEHSIGVCYLAGKLCQTLMKRQPELNILEKDLLCIKIAGLCHDLGHGPFSHLFDGVFLPMVYGNKQWRHETGSIEMLDHLIEENDLWPLFESWGLTQTDLIFIKEIIASCQIKSEEEWNLKGRGRDKSYLYQIVANKTTGIDVDKMDYFARDCYHLGIRNNFDYKRYMKFARVVNVEGELQICTRDKEAGTLYDMFHTRNSLHWKAYQHKTGKIIDMMYTHVLLKADPFFEIPSKNGNKRISQSIYDMAAYTNLSDTIFHMIYMSADPRLNEAKSILQRIKRRDLYGFVGQTILCDRNDETRPDEFRKQIVSESKTNLVESDFIVHIIDFDYGKKDQNPIDHVRFYHKQVPDVAVRVRKEQVSRMLPETFAEKHIRLYCIKNDPEIIREGQRCFKIWCKETQGSTPRICSTHSELTPYKTSRPKHSEAHKRIPRLDFDK